MTKRFFTAAIISALSLGAACGKDSTAPNANLTQAQAEEMMDAMSAVGIGFAPTAAGSASAARAALVTLQVDERDECPVSGTIHTVGTLGVNDAFTQVTANVQQTHEACAATSQQSGKTWTFNGNPNVTTDVTANVTNQETGAGNFSGTQKGTISFSTAGLNGSCTIDLSFNATTNDVGVTTGTVTGTVCGKDVSQSFTE